MAQIAAQNGYTPLETSRSLTLVAPQCDSQSRPGVRAEIGFLAHLLAARLDAPQYRTKRREQPGAAANAYAMRLSAARAHGASVAA
jgi:hypothetical protein